MIDIVNLWHHYGVRPTLRGINLRIETGELLCVMGPNGMGKSTLLGIVAGLLWPIKGHVEINGLRRRANIEDEKQIRKQVYFLPATPWLPLGHSGREFLLATGRVYHVDEDALYDHVERVLDLFDLKSKADVQIADYSAGQMKKIGICSALVSEAQVLLLDEPFSGGLDSSALTALEEVLRRLSQRKDVTVMMAVPVPELVENLADRIAVLVDGEIVACESVSAIRQLSGPDLTFATALEKLIHPDKGNKVDRYFTAERKR